MISIVMPVHNGDKFIGETITSVLNSTISNYEFLIINDGSTDNTEKIIKSFSDKRIKYFKKSNSGIAETLNYGLKKASHEIIARIDSDDLIFPDRLLKQLNYFKKNKVDILGSNAILINDRNFEFGKTFFPTEHNQIKKKLENFICPILHPSVMYKKSKVLQFGGYKENYADDYELWLRMLKSCVFSNLKEPLIYLRKHSNNLSSKKTLQTQTIIVESLIKYFEFKGEIKEVKKDYIQSKSELITTLKKGESIQNKIKLLLLYVRVLKAKKSLLKLIR